MEIDFSTKSTKELFEALQGVDDYEYPENALRIYKLLLKKLDLPETGVDSQTLGYDTIVLIDLFVLGASSDVHNENVEMRDKIQRLNSRLKK